MDSFGRIITGGRAVAIFALVLFAALSLGGCGIKDPVVPEVAKIENTVLFPSNDRVLTTYCPAVVAETRKCRLAAWDLDGGNLKIYRQPAHHSWMDARFSPDGTEIVFVLNETGRYSTKLAIMELATEQVRIVEGNNSYKLWPSFHPNGGKVIFATVSRTPDNTRTRTRVRVAGVDIYSLDLASGKTKALTDYDFRQASRPLYTGHEDDFVYGGYFPLKILLDSQNEYYKDKKIGDYDEEYRGNSIITVTNDRNDWRPDFVIGGPIKITVGPYSGDAIPSQNGSTYYFESNSDAINLCPYNTCTSAIWMRRDGKNTRWMYFYEITKFKLNFADFSLSNDENYFLIWSRGNPFGTWKSDEGLWRVGVDGSDPRRIPIPWERLAAKSGVAGAGQ